MATYSFMDVQVALEGPGGAFTIGANDAQVADEGITFEPTGEKNTMTPSASGGGMHSLHADKSAKVTIRLLKTSPVNQKLSQLYGFQTTSSANHGQNTITCRDPQRGDLVTAKQTAFAKNVSLTYAKEGGMNEWEFHSLLYDELLGSGAPTR